MQTSRIRRCWDQMRWLFNFKKPRFTELVYLDLVIEDKPLLVLHWLATDARRLAIMPGRKNYAGFGNTIIYTLPSQTELVRLHLKNFWRKEMLLLPIRRTTLDADTASHLLAKLNAANMFPTSRGKSPLDPLMCHRLVPLIAARISSVHAQAARPALRVIAAGLKSIHARPYSYQVHPFHYPK